MTRVEVGVRYCPVHHGVANEDDDVCDFSRIDAEESDCDFRDLFYEEAE